MLTGKPWKLEAVLFYFAGVLSCVFLGQLSILALKTLWPNLSTVDRTFYEFLVGGVGLQVIPLILTHLLLRQHDLSWREFLGFHRTPIGGAVIRAVLVAMLAVPMALLLNTVSGMLITELQSRPAEHQPSMQVLEISYTLGRRIIFSVAAIFVAPVTEEILFRGVLYAALKEGGYPVGGMIGSSLLFAAIHGSLMTMLPLTFFAVVLVLLYERTGSLFAPILCHASFNAANILSYLVQHGSAAHAIR